MTIPICNSPNKNDFLISQLFTDMNRINNDLILLKIETVKTTSLAIESAILLDESLEATQNVLIDAEVNASKQNQKIKKIKEEMNTPLMKVLRAICNFVSYIFNTACKVFIYAHETSSYPISKAYNFINLTLRIISARE